MRWRLSTRSAHRGDPRWWIGAVVLASSAAAAAYLFDPDRGRGRRTRIAERTAHLARKASRRVVRQVRYLSGSLSQRVRHRLFGAPAAYAESGTLLDRVESELFADPQIPRGSMNLEVEGTTVVLRGELESQQQIERVETAVRKIPGVRNVKNLLHRSGTPAPNKLAALMASAGAAAEERWPEEPPPDVDSEISVVTAGSATDAEKEA